MSFYFRFLFLLQGCLDIYLESLWICLWVKAAGMNFPFFASFLFFASCWLEEILYQNSRNSWLWWIKALILRKICKYFGHDYFFTAAHCSQGQRKECTTVPSLIFFTVWASSMFMLSCICLEAMYYCEWTSQTTASLLEEQNSSSNQKRLNTFWTLILAHTWIFAHITNQTSIREALDYLDGWKGLL